SSQVRRREASSAASTSSGRGRWDRLVAAAPDGCHRRILRASLGLLLVGLMPVAWLFSASSRYLATAVWLHVLLWLLAVFFGWRFLGHALRETGARGVMIPWLLLFCL